MFSPWLWLHLIGHQHIRTCILLAQWRWSHNIRKDGLVVLLVSRGREQYRVISGGSCQGSDAFCKILPENNKGAKDWSLWKGVWRDVMVARSVQKQFLMLVLQLARQLDGFKNKEDVLWPNLQSRIYWNRHVGLWWSEIETPFPNASFANRLAKRIENWRLGVERWCTRQLTMIVVV